MNTIPEEVRLRILSKPFHSQAEVAEMLGISGQTFEKARQGRIKYMKELSYTRVGRRILYPAQSIIEFIESLPTFRHQ